MVHTLVASVFGTVLGVVTGVATLLYLGASGEGLEPLVTLVSTSCAGSLTAAPLGIFTGVTGGIIGGLVGVVFVLLPLPAWLFANIPLGVFAVKVLVAGAIAASVPLVFPH